MLRTFGVVGLTLVVSAPLGAQVTPSDSVVAKRHTLVQDGRTIRYTARAGLILGT